jgi:drug/metabolite transporter (DMT)-like permease
MPLRLLPSRLLPLRQTHLAYLAMLGAVIIFGANFALSRHGILNGLTPNDMLLLRFLVAGVVLLPLVLRAGIRDAAGIGWGRGLLLTVMSGLPMSTCMMVGLKYAPAAHGATIAPGTVTTIGILGSWLMFGARPTRAIFIGIGTVLAGLALIGISGTTSPLPHTSFGDLCFLGVGLFWGGYPLLLQRWKIDGLRAVALLSVLSAILVVPFYFVMGGGTITTAPLGTILLHGFNQGILNVLVGLWLWGYAVRHVGAASAGRFPPLIPVIGTLCAIPLLGEWPVPLQWAGVVLIVAGLFITTLRRTPAAPKPTLP